MPEDDRIEGERGIMDRAVCISVELHRFGIRKKVKSSEVETDAEDDMIHVSKQILKSERLAAVTSYHTEIRRMIASHCLPSGFRIGIHLLPDGLIEVVDRGLKWMIEQNNLLVERFMDEYETVSAAAEAQLGTLYDPRNYPPKDRVRKQFWIEYHFVQFGAPGKLRGINPEMHDREVQKMKDSFAEATELCKEVVRVEMANLTNHLVDRLSVGDDGKPKVFRDTVVGNVRAFFETFNARNIVDDADLSRLVDDARKLLDGVDPQQLRDSDSVRATVHQGFAEIKKTLDSWQIDKPSRRIKFDEADDAAAPAPEAPAAKLTRRSKRATTRSETSADAAP